MVDGINTINPRLPGIGETSEAGPKVVVPNKSKETQQTNQPNQIGRDESNGVSSVIAKSAERRFQSLVSGDVSDYLQAAEKLISASLPRQAPGTRLRINIDDSSGRFIYQGIDTKTGDVVTQFPSEEILRSLAFNRKRESHEGIVVDEKA